MNYDKTEIPATDDKARALSPETFEEPGTLEAVVEHARGWFLKHFTEAKP
jgi:hypothetical protein